MSPERFPIGPLTSLIVALLSLALSAFVGYTRTDRETAARITAVEVQQKNDHDGIGRVENKVDELNRKVDRLVEGMLRGSKSK